MALHSHRYTASPHTRFTELSHYTSTPHSTLHLHTLRTHTSTCIPLRYLEEAGSTDSVDIQFTNVNKMKNRGEDFLAINPLGEGKVGASVYTYHPTL